MINFTNKKADKPCKYAIKADTKSNLGKFNFSFTEYVKTKVFPWPGPKECTIPYKKVKNILGFSIVLGLCPCPGVMTVLLFLESFGLSENLFLFTLSMSTGIFLVILFFGILANTFKKTLVEDENLRLHKILALVGAVLMILFGIFQILILGE